VTERQRGQSDGPQRLTPGGERLRPQRTRLRSFVEVLQAKFCDLAERFTGPLAPVQALWELEGLDSRGALDWQRLAHRQTRRKDRWYPIRQAVLEARAPTPRARSLGENRNRRLRSYFFWRREIGPGYLPLRRFFRNHRRFLRRDRPARVGKSPAEILTGQTHPHWLELLGYPRFHRNGGASLSGSSTPPGVPLFAHATLIPHPLSPEIAPI
jgi:hypothetical protein